MCFYVSGLLDQVCVVICLHHMHHLGGFQQRVGPVTTMTGCLRRRRNTMLIPLVACTIRQEQQQQKQQQVFDQRQTNKSRQCTSWLGLDFQHHSVSLANRQATTTHHFWGVYVAAAAPLFSFSITSHLKIVKYYLLLSADWLFLSLWARFLRMVNSNLDFKFRKVTGKSAVIVSQIPGSVR